MAAGPGTRPRGRQRSACQSAKCDRSTSVADTGSASSPIVRMRRCWLRSRPDPSMALLRLQLRHDGLRQEHDGPADPPQPATPPPVRPAADEARPRGWPGHEPSRRGRRRHRRDADLDLHALALEHWPIHYLVCDEAQFYTSEQCDQLARVVDELEVDVYAFGLITDFRGRLFEGTKRLLEIADERVPMQVEARCWCGSRATHNARVVNGDVVYEGETIVVGDTEDPTDAAAVRRRRALRAALPPPLPRRRPRHLNRVSDRVTRSASRTGCSRPPTATSPSARPPGTPRAATRPTRAPGVVGEQPLTSVPRRRRAGSTTIVGVAPGDLDQQADEVADRDLPARCRG